MRKHCLNCKNFQFSPAPPHMRSCQFKGKLVMNGAFCGCWRNQYSFFERLLIRLGVKKPYAKSLVI